METGPLEEFGAGSITVDIYLFVAGLLDVLLIELFLVCYVLGRDEKF